jgi:hypothetical protein
VNLYRPVLARRGKDRVKRKMDCWQGSRRRGASRGSRQAAKRSQGAAPSFKHTLLVRARLLGTLAPWREPATPACVRDDPS